MAFDGFVAGGTMLCCVGIGESGPTCIVACFDGCQPSGLDWEARCCMEIHDQGTDAGEVMCIEGY